MNTKPTGYPIIDEILESIAPKTPMLPNSGAGEWRVEPLAIHGWRVMETATGREVVSCVYRKEDAERIVADHAAVPRLADTLRLTQQLLTNQLTCEQSLCESCQTGRQTVLKAIAFALITTPPTAGEGT